MDPRLRLADFSSLSVINVVDRFVKAVDVMNETVMVPSRLLNVELPEKSDKIPYLLRGSDPYTFYTVLNNVKNNIVWGLSETDHIEEKLTSDNSAWLTGQAINTVSNKSSKNNSETSSSKTVPCTSSNNKGHFRSISSVSNSSITSSISNSESENERLSDTGDSGVDSIETLEPITEVTSALRTHLTGLQDCLQSLTETAKFITDKYQEDFSV